MCRSVLADVLEAGGLAYLVAGQEPTKRARRQNRDPEDGWDQSDGVYER